MTISGELAIDHKTGKILDVKYGFSRPVDEKRRPTTGCQSGGLINIIVETNDDDTFIDKFKYNRAFECKVEIFSGRDRRVVRCLEYEEVYLVGIDEVFSSRVGMPMLTYITLSPTKMKLHGIPLTRRWPEVQGFWWEVKEDEPVTYTRITKKNIQIEDAYWIDKDGVEHHTTPTSPTTLYIPVIGAEHGNRINFDFLNDKNELVYEELGVTVNKNLIAEIPDFSYKERLTVKSPDDNVTQSVKMKPIILITEVKGETSSNSGVVLTYEVVKFNQDDVSLSVHNLIKWSVKIDDVVTDVIDDATQEQPNGKKLSLKILQEWEGKTIVVMPYLNQPTEKVSVKTDVKEYLKRLIVYIHGTTSNVHRWDDNLETLKVCNKIAMNPREDELALIVSKDWIDKNCVFFDWYGNERGKDSNGKDLMFNGLLNNVVDRNKASNKLIEELTTVTRIGSRTKISTTSPLDFDEIVLIGHSHGGNVALQTAERLTKIYKYVYVLTIATPAHNNKRIRSIGEKLNGFGVPVNDIIPETEIIDNGSMAEIKDITRYEYINPENPANILATNFNHIALWNKKDHIDAASDVINKYDGSDSTNHNCYPTIEGKSKSIEIITAGCVANILKQHSFDLKYLEAIEAAINNKLIMPWPRVVKEVNTEEKKADPRK